MIIKELNKSYKKTTTTTTNEKSSFVAKELEYD